MIGALRFKMAALPDLATPEGLAAAVEALDPDFHGLLERKEVSQMVQGRLSNANVRCISRFAALGDNRTDIRTFCTGTLALDRAADVVEIAGVVDTWQASKSRMGVETPGRGRGFLGEFAESSQQGGSSGSEAEV